MLRVAEQIRAARQSTAAVCVLGEKGTGKEHLARALHGLGPTSNRAFVPVDCARLPAFELKQTLRRLFPEEDLELAEESPVPGLQPGSVYLQNVESLPRDLQEMVVTAHRASPPWKAGERRLLTGSSADLRRAMADEILRRDFYFLVTPIQIELPPLRLRKEDLAPLAQSILEDLNRGDERQVGGFAEDVWEHFREYHWPGNVDELVAVTTESRAKSADGLVRSRDLPFRFRAGQDAQSIGPPVSTSVAPLEPLLVQVETDEIRRALDQARNNKTKAAELLGITRPRLYRRMQTLGIEDREEEKGTS
jgi:DNA-binding NtrC family response regulator